MTYSFRNIKKRSIALLLILSFVIPMNLLLSDGNLGGSYYKDDDELEENEDINKAKDVKNIIKGSAIPVVDEVTLKINGTEIYENGTFYCFQNDWLNFSVHNHTTIKEDSVKITIPNFDAGPELSLPYQDGENVSYSAPVEFNDDAALYNCTLEYINDTSGGFLRQFTFFIKLNNPAPVITGVTVKNEEYNPIWAPLAEGGIYSTYRETTLHLRVDTLNKDDFTNDVVISYSDGYYNYKKNITTIASDQGTKRTFESSGTEGIIINVNTTEGYEDSWLPNENLYPVVLNASGRDDDENYIFKFFIEVKNKPPEITMMEFEEQRYVPSSSEDNYNVTLKINATDLEDDLLYFRNDNDERYAYYFDKVSSYQNISCLINNTVDKKYPLYDNDTNTFYNLTMFQPSTSEFIVNFKIGSEINLSNVDQLDTFLRISDNKTGSGSSSLSLYDYTNEQWDSIANLHTDVTGGLDQANVISDNFLNPDDYFESLNRTIRLKITYSTYTHDIKVLLRDIGIRLKVNRRESFSSLMLKVVKPNELDEDVSVNYEIINNWESSEDIWYFTYNIRNLASNYGSYTFILDVMDHGNREYVPVHIGNFSLETAESSSPKSTHNYDYNADSSEFFAISRASKVFCFGMSEADAFNISSRPKYYSSTGEPIDTDHLRENDLNITVNVNGIDTSQSVYYKVFTKRREPEEMKIQRNDTQTFTINGDRIFDKNNLSGDEDDMLVNDGTSFEILLNRSKDGTYGYHSVAWHIKLEEKWWLTKDDYTGIFIDIDNFINDTGTDLDQIQLEFYNYSSKKWFCINSSFAEGNLRKTGDDGGSAANRLVEWIHNKTILNSIIYEPIGTTTLQLLMRLNLSISGINDFKVGIDYLNVKVQYNNSFSAKVKLVNVLNYEMDVTDVEFLMTPYKLPSGEVQYSTVINPKSLGLFGEIFALKFTMQNGNSSIILDTFRSEPRFFRTDQTELDYSMSRVYYYNKTEENDNINTNHTLYIHNSFVNVGKDIQIRQYDTQLDKTVDSIIFHRNNDRINVTGTLDLKSLKDNETNALSDIRIQFKMGTEYTYEYWMSYQITYDYDDKEWSFFSPIDTTINVGVYYCRIYVRDQFGVENFSNWKTFRVQNFQPVDFEFGFYNDAEKIVNRSENFDFTFSFLDFDMTESLAQDPNVVKAMLLVNDSRDDELRWVNFTGTDVIYQEIDSGRVSFIINVVIPEWTATGSYNKTYIEWRLIVNDTNGYQESQISLLQYNRTKFIVKNYVPFIYDLTATNQVYRSYNQTLAFKIKDNEETNPTQNNDVMQILVKAPNSDTRINYTPKDTDDGFLRYNSLNQKREFEFTVATNWAVGIYTASIKVNDSEGRTALKSISFGVLNNYPSIIKAALSNNETYRDSGPAINFKVNLTDVEDSLCSSAWITLYHQQKYSELIKSVSPKIEPYRFKLEGKSLGSNIQAWNRSLILNTTMLGQIFFAGNITVELNITDSDGQTVLAENQTFIMQNSPPSFTKAQISNFSMSTEEIYFTEDTVVRGDTLEFYVFASDIEGLNRIILSCYQIGAGEKKSKDFKFEANNWTRENYGGITVYKLIINTTDFPNYVEYLQIDTVTLIDIDHGYKHPLKYGATSSVADIGKVVTLTSEGGGGQDFMVWIFVIIGIVAVSVVSVVGVIYWRKKTGWKRFMD